MTETALIVPEVEAEELEFHLVARSTQEMDAARTQLKDWLRAKIKMVAHDSEELIQARDMAIKQKWGNATLKRHAEKSHSRLSFYQKVLAAVEAGYTIVPNFPVDIFAVRVNRTKPPVTQHHEDSEWRRPDVPTVEVKALPAETGHYVSDIHRGHSSQQTIQPEGKAAFTRQWFKVTDYGEVEFPISCARPLVMNATAEAMALKVFDAIGICPQRTVKRDPLIIGQVRMKKYGWQEARTVSFLIAWHLDMRTL